MLHRQVSLKVRSVQVQIKRALRSSSAGPYPENVIIVHLQDRRLILRDFQELFRFVEQNLNRDTVEALYRLLDREDLCIRCGYCCITGAPPITLDDAARLIECSQVRTMIISIAKNLNINNVTNLRSKRELFIIWNALIDFLRPCPFLQTCRDITSCLIYDVKPSFCTLFKCWSPYTDKRRRKHIHTVLADIDKVMKEVQDSSLIKLLEVARSRVTLMLTYCSR